MAGHPKFPGDYRPSTPEATPDPPESSQAGFSSPSLEESKSPPLSPTQLSHSCDSNITTKIADSLNPKSAARPEVPTMSLDQQSSGDSSNSSSLKPITEKLNDTNFSTWQYAICNALAYQDLDGYIKEHTPALKARLDYKAKVKKVTTFIRLHLGYEDSSRFVDNLDVYNPKALWDAILEFHAAKTVKNAANIMERLHDSVFVDREMQKNINVFRQTLQLMIEVSSNKFDKKTLEAVWVFFVLKRLPQSFHMF
jgi:hypothetical protein